MYTDSPGGGTDAVARYASFAEITCPAFFYSTRPILCLSFLVSEKLALSFSI